MIKLTSKELEAIYMEESDKHFLVEEDKWISQGKYETKDIIFRDEETEKTYRGYVSRSGDYYSDYTWESEYANMEVQCKAVAKKEITITKWVSIEEDK